MDLLMINLILNIIFAIFEICCIIYTVCSFLFFIGVLMKQSNNKKLFEDALQGAVIADFKKSIDDKKIN
jgi:hypothetical protein